MKVHISTLSALATLRHLFLATCFALPAAQAQFNVELDVTNVNGQPFDAQAELELWQTSSLSIDKWRADSVQFLPNGTAQHTFTSLPGIDTSSSVWVVVRKRDGFAPPEFGTFFKNKGDAARGMVRTKFKSSAPGGSMSLTASMQLTSVPLYGEVKVLGASAANTYSIYVSEFATSSSTAYDRVEVSASTSFQELYSWSIQNSAQIVVQDSTDHVVHRGSLARGAQLVIDPSALGHIRIDVGPHIHGDFAGIFLVPSSTYTPPSASERVSLIRTHMRLQGPLRDYQCYQISGTNNYETDGRVAGSYTLEVWRKSDLQGAGPYMPSHSTAITITPGNVINYQLP